MSRGARAIASLLLWSGGCVSTIESPVDPSQPVTVYLRREARHAGLLLPRTAGGFVEYGFGDHDWYALNKDRWYHVFDTLLWPTRGTLARRDCPSEDVLALQASYPFSTLTPIVVGGSEASRLEERLAAEYRASEGTELYNPRYVLFFVEHEDRFWLFHNCHDAVAGWLRELGCSVGFAPIRVGLAVKPPSPSHR